MLTPPTVGAFDAPTTQLEINDVWLSYLYALVGRAARLSFWEGSDTEKQNAVDQVEAVITAMMLGNIRQQLGEIVTHALETLPDNWLPCNGLVYLRADYPDLYDVLHPSLINNADEFTTPNLMGRVPVGGHYLPGGTVLGGQSFNDDGGEQNVILSTANLPAHNHAWQVANTQVMLNTGATATGLRITGVAGSGVYVQPTGGPATANTGAGTAHNNMPPYRIVNYAIVAR